MSPASRRNCCSRTPARFEFIDNNGYLHTAWDEHADATHRMLDAGGALVGSLKTQCRVPAMIVPGLVADHAPINYATLLWNNLDR